MSVFLFCGKDVRRIDGRRPFADFGDSAEQAGGGFVAYSDGAFAVGVSSIANGRAVQADCCGLNANS